MQIVEQVRQLIALGELVPGDQLPTMRQLATELRVNFNTIARAYHLLDEAGLISTQHGRGTFVWDQPSEETAQQIRHHGLQDLIHQTLEEAKRLGYSYEEIITAFEKENKALTSEKTEE